MAEELLKKYGANSYNAAYKLVKEKLLSAIDHAKKSPPWREPATDWPRTMKGIFKKLGKVTKVALGVGLIATNIVLDGVGLILGAITKQ